MHGRCAEEIPDSTAEARSITASKKREPLRDQIGNQGQSWSSMLCERRGLDSGMGFWDNLDGLLGDSNFARKSEDLDPRLVDVLKNAQTLHDAGALTPERMINLCQGQESWLRAIKEMRSEYLPGGIKTKDAIQEAAGAGLVILLTDRY